ncbi:hypothetical protein A0J61_00983 [Choanephora cucurbitarum]|uniref:Pheromone-regulated membrane protein 10 n=1 Tax=Choanephora cucurbitarum TaxID=101091 RepID=A0A1C7NPZ1_9FUNG|nr:hypothetical protein A0J61_00983 [Choanephora cucurbitarum]
MEGNKFHDPETPPPIDLSAIHPVFSRHQEDLETEKHEIVSNPIEMSSNETEGPSHTDQAFHLVNSVTRENVRRRPSKAGILSNLLKLDVFEDHLRHPQTRQGGRPSRSLHQLHSIASNRAFLQSKPVSPNDPSSGQNSVYQDETTVHSMAELGMLNDKDVPAIAAHRMAIASEIADILHRQEVIIKMGKCLVRTGAPSHRIEAAMDKVSKRLEIDGSYAVLPGLIVVTFGDVETHTSETHLIRCSRSLDINKLEKSNLIAHKLAKGELDLDEASKRLDDIIHSPPTWSPAWLMLGYIGSSAFVAPLFFNGSWTDCWVSAIFGLCVGILTYISEKMPMFGNVFEMAITIPIAIIALALHSYVCFAAIALSAIVIALPGYSLTCSVMELAAKNLVSGTVHLVYALMYILFLAFGIGYGCSVWRLAYPELDLNVLGTCEDGINPYWTFLLLPLAIMAIGLVYGAHYRQWPSMIADSAIAYAVYYFVSKYVGSTNVIAPSAGAFALGLAGNIYARVTRRQAFAPLMSGTLILVPGSLGVRGAVHLFDGSNNGSGSEFVFQILGIALSITLGLFLANLVVYPTGKKRSVFLGF